MTRFHVRLHWSQDEDWSGWHEAEDLADAVRVALDSLDARLFPGRVPRHLVHVTVHAE
jgi:hypothetical protein